MTLSQLHFEFGCYHSFILVIYQYNLVLWAKKNFFSLLLDEIQRQEH